MAGRGDIQIQNPCTKWFKWKGSTGTVVYYDKLTKEDVEVKLPFTFLLLDVLATIKGFDKSTKESIWSNEVRNTKETPLLVKKGSVLFKNGMYSDIKADVVSAGGGYASSCYIAFKDEAGKLTIGNIIMAGSSLGGGVHKPADKKLKDIEVGAWIEFTKAFKNELYNKAIQIVDKDDRICTEGNVQFYCPKFALIETTPETDKAAIELNKELQAYLETYLKIEAKPTETVAPVAEAAPQVSKEEQFEKNAEEKPFDIPKKETAITEVVIPAEPDDLPF